VKWKAWGRGLRITTALLRRVHRECVMIKWDENISNNAEYERIAV